MRYVLVFSYDGSKFYGFQRQNDKRSVQKELEDNLSKIFNEDVKIKGAGRTDRGVHALGQTAHFDSKKSINLRFVKKYLNDNISDLKVKKCFITNDGFHSRFSVKKKHYRYVISFNKKDYKSDYVYYHNKLNIDLMKKASKEFLGVHNFQNFVSGYRDNYDCIIYAIKFKKRFNRLIIDFYGKSFYRYMVRNMVGALVDIGRGKSDINYLIKLLNSDKTDKMLSTAPSKGLTLVKIYY